MRKVLLVLGIGLIVVVLGGVLAPVALAEESEEASPKLMGVVHIGPIQDGGWTEAHDVGLREVLEEYGELVVISPGHYEVIDDNGKVVIKMVSVESVGPEDFRLNAVSLIEQGADLIIGTAENYRRDVDDLSRLFPNVDFAVIHGNYEETQPNVVSYFGQMQTPWYALGVLGASMSETGTACFVGAYEKNGQVVVNLAAFIRGWLTVNPEGHVATLFTNTWYSPPLEREAAEACPIEADVYAAHQDSPTVGQVAVEKGLFALGYDSDWSKKVEAPELILASAVWDWSPIYRSLAEGMMSGDWPAGRHWSGLPVVGIAPMSPLVPESLREEIIKLLEKINSGEIEVFPEMTDKEVWQLDNWQKAAGLTE